ncbi:hypothetical protein [Bifidobacterium tissieri]|nr:hypothetical protein [Bifidobacterium tissieri]
MVDSVSNGDGVASVGVAPADEIPAGEVSDGGFDNEVSAGGVLEA